MIEVTAIIAKFSPGEIDEFWHQQCRPCASSRPRKPWSFPTCEVGFFSRTRDNQADSSGAVVMTAAVAVVVVIALMVPAVVSAATTIKRS